MMIIDCPSCSAQFRAPPLAPAQKVRCSACGHVWAYTPVTDNISEVSDMSAISSFADSMDQMADVALPPISEKAEIISSDTAQAPTSQPIEPLFTSSRAAIKALFYHSITPVRLRAYVALVLVVLITFSFLGLIRPVLTMIVPSSQVTYDLFGAYAPPPVYPLVFKDVHVKADETTLEIKGSVVNQTKTQRAIPPVRVVVRGNKGSALADLPPIVFRLDARFINPDETIGFDMKRTIEQAGDISATELEFIQEK